MNNEMPGMTAKLFESGMMPVFPMTTAEADEVLKKLFRLSAS